MTTEDQQERLLSLLLHDDPALARQGLELARALSGPERRRLGEAMLAAAERAKTRVDPWAFFWLVEEGRAAQRARQFAYDGAVWLLDALDRAAGHRGSSGPKGRIPRPVQEALQIASRHVQGQATPAERERAAALLHAARHAQPAYASPPHPASPVEWALHPDPAAAARQVAEQGAWFNGRINVYYRGGVSAAGAAIRDGREAAYAWQRRYLGQQLLAERAPEPPPTTDRIGFVWARRRER